MDSLLSYVTLFAASSILWMIINHKRAIAQIGKPRLEHPVQDIPSPVKKPKIEKFTNNEPIFSGHESIFGKLEKSLHPREERVILVPTYSEKGISTYDLEENSELEIRRLTSTERLNPDETRKNLISSKLSAEKKYASNYTGESLKEKKRKFYEKLNTVINSPQKKPYGTLKPVLGHNGRTVVNDSKIVVRGEDSLDNRTEKNVLDLGYVPVRASGRVDLSQTTRFELPGANKDVIVGEKGRDENLPGKVDGSKTPLFGEHSGNKGGFGQFSELQQGTMLGKRMGNNEEDAPKQIFANIGEKQGLFPPVQENSLFSTSSNKGGLFSSGAPTGISPSSSGLFPQGNLNSSSLFNKPENPASDIFKPESKPNEPAKQTLFGQGDSSKLSIPLSSDPQKSLFAPNQGNLFGGPKFGEIKNEEKKNEAKPEENKGQTSLFGNFAGNSISKSDKEPGTSGSGLFTNSGGNTSGGLFNPGFLSKEPEKNTGSSFPSNSLFSGVEKGEMRSLFGSNAGANLSSNVPGSNKVENSQKTELFGAKTGDNQSGSSLWSGLNKEGSLLGSNTAVNTNGGLFGERTVISQTTGLFSGTTSDNKAGLPFGSLSTENKTGNLFGSKIGGEKPANSFGSSQGSLFGSIGAGNSANNNKEGLSTSNPSGNSTTTLFGGNSTGNNTNQLFGGSSNSVFGANSSTSLFGNNPSNNSGGLFGSTNKTNNPAGVPDDKSSEKNESKPFGVGFAGSTFQSSNPTNICK